MPPFPGKAPRLRVYLAAIAAWFLGVALVCATSEDPRTPIRFLPHWIPQSQFAGFYVAADQGFYTEAGLDVKILPSGPEHPASRLLPAGDTDFATMFLTNGIVMRDQGEPVVLLAQMLHQSSLLLVTHRDSGITRPEDLDGKKVAIWTEFQAQPLALFRKFGIEPIIIAQGASMGVFQHRGVDAACAMRYNEYQNLYLAGFDESDLNVIDLEQHGVGFPEDGIYVTEDFLENSPEAAAAFVEASLRGWRHAFDHPEEAVDSVMKRIQQAGRHSSRALQKRMLLALQTAYLQANGELHPTRLTEEDFDRVTSALSHSGELRHLPRYDSFHRPENSAR